MIVVTSDAEIIIQKRINERIGYIKGKIETAHQCIKDIESITEYDIWFPAWEQTKEGLKKMQKLVDSGTIR